MKRVVLTGPSVEANEKHMEDLTMGKMALTSVIDELAPLTPAVMYEAAAAKYVMLGIHDFRKLVDSGVIPFRTHPGRIRRIYLKKDLEIYLSQLPLGVVRTETQERHTTIRNASDDSSVIEVVER